MRAGTIVDTIIIAAPQLDQNAANVKEVTQAGALLHGQEAAAFGDAGYRGVHKRNATGR